MMQLQQSHCSNALLQRRSVASPTARSQRRAALHPPQQHHHQQHHTSNEEATASEPPAASRAAAAAVGPAAPLAPVRPCWLQHAARSAVMAAAAAMLVLLPGGGGAAAAALAGDLGGRVDPVYDGASLLKADVRSRLSQQLSELDERTGYHVRLWTSYQLDRTPDGPRPRTVFGPLDNDTLVLVVDPSAPNIINVAFVGDNVLAKLHRPFWTELAARFGNLFAVREQGEAAQVLAAMSAISSCLDAPTGCRVVPGLPQEQYAATLVCSLAGGLTAGLVSKIEPQGIVRRRGVWVLLFSPLWGSLFVNFGLGPIVSRTADIAPLAANTAAFLAAAAAPWLLQRAWDGGATGGGSSGGPPDERSTLP